jgi:hypothetical protein
MSADVCSDLPKLEETMKPSKADIVAHKTQRKVKLSLPLIKHYAMKTYGGVEV